MSERPDDDIIARVTRLIKGGRVVEDLNRIFGHFRFITKGRAPAVKDIADFNGHREGRNQGASWARGREQLEITSHFQFFRDNGKMIGTRQSFKRVVDAHLNIINPQELQSNLGISPKKARQIMADLTRKVIFTQGSNVRVFGSINAQEYSIVEYISQLHLIEYLFDNKSLIDQLTFLLIRDNFIEENDIEQFNQCDRFISTYAMAALHRSSFIFDSGKATLKLSTMTGQACIHAIFEFNAIQYAAPIFRSGIHPTECLDPSLLERDIIDVPIEIDSRGLLVPLL